MEPQARAAATRSGGGARGAAVALTQDEFPVVFGALALVAGTPHAVAFALGLMLLERVDLICNLRRDDVHDSRADPEYGTVASRSVNKKTVPRNGWMSDPQRGVREEGGQSRLRADRAVVLGRPQEERGAFPGVGASARGGGEI
eukprot:5335197-Pyramimonas_sp.AAC.1